MPDTGRLDQIYQTRNLHNTYIYISIMEIASLVYLETRIAVSGGQPCQLCLRLENPRTPTLHGALLYIENIKSVV